MKKYLYLIFILFPSFAFATNYYINPAASPGGNGLSHATAFDEHTDFTPAPGNAYRFICDGNVTLTNTDWEISQDGNATSRIFIGAYYMDGEDEVHEDDNPSLGETCGNSAQKPLFRRSNAVGDTLNISGDYITLNSIQAERGARSIRSSGAYMIAEYCVSGAGAANWGIRFISTSSYGTVRYCKVAIEYGRWGEQGTDGISLDWSDHHTIHHNEIDSFNHSWIMLSNASYNEVYENLGTNSEYLGGKFFDINYSSNYNTFSYNLGIDQGDGSQIGGGTGNVFQYNWFVGACQQSEHADCDFRESSPPPAMLSIQSIDNAAISDNVIINNSVYVEDEDYAIAFQIYSDGTSDGDIDNNAFINNAAYMGNPATSTTRMILIQSNSDPNWGTQVFRNNQIYLTNGTANVHHYGSPMTIAEFNADTTDTTSGNQLGDPLFTNPALYDLSLQVSSPCIDNGYNAGASYDEGLSSSTSLPPNTITAIDQDLHGDGWEIGAFVRSGIVLSGLAPTSQQECGSDPQSVTMQATSDVNAYCRYSTNVAHTTYADMSGNQWSTGEGTTSHSTSISQACDGSTLYYVICNTAADGSGDSSARYEITVDVAASGSSEPPPLTIEYNDNGINVEYGNSLAIETQ